MDKSKEDDWSKEMMQSASGSLIRQLRDEGAKDAGGSGAEGRGDCSELVSMVKLERVRESLATTGGIIEQPNDSERGERLDTLYTLKRQGSSVFAPFLRIETKPGARKTIS